MTKRNRQTHGGKGDNPRHLNNKKKYDDNYISIFGKKCFLNHTHDKECGGKSDKRT